MNPVLTLVFSILAAVMLFLHGLAAFSDEMARLGGERLREALGRLTRTDWRGAIIGAPVTAVVQSSSAVTSMAVWLVVAANIGTTSTALLASTALDWLARKLALLNTGFNLLGVVVFATLLQPFVGMIFSMPIGAVQQVAMTHVAAAVAALLLMAQVWAANRHLAEEGGLSDRGTPSDSSPRASSASQR